MTMSFMTLLVLHFHPQMTQMSADGYDRNASEEPFMSISAITDRRVHIQPSDVHNVISRPMLAYRYDVVIDLNRSKLSWLSDARRGRAVLDFFTNFASIPIGYN